MTPNFALSLSFDGIRLLQRVSGGWGLVGEVALDTPDLTGALYVLRQTAEEYTRDAVATKLIIPNEQIRYLSVQTGDVDDAGRWVAVRAALDGATPYAVDDLAFDMSTDGPNTRVAAVAKETLLEAESFAAAHGFNPVCFVAAPEADEFPCEPSFGETSLFKAEHGPGATIAADDVPVQVVGPAVKPEPDEISEPPEPNEAETDLQVSPDVAEAREDEKATEAEEVSAESARPDQPDDIAAQDEDTENSEIVSPPQEPATASQPSEDTAEADDTAKAASKDEIAPDEASEQVVEADTSVAASMPDEATPVTEEASPEPDPDEDPDVLPVFSRNPRSAPEPEPEAPDPEPAPEPSTNVGFSSRRGQGANAPRLGGVTRPGQPAAQGVAAPSIPIENDAPRAAPLPEPPPAAAASLAAHVPETRIEPILPSPAQRTPVQPVPAATPAAAVTFDEAERLTIFGARQGAPGAKPRFLGLLLTVILLVFLAGVAAWATVFMDDGLASLFRSRAAPEPEIAVVPEPAPEIATPAPAVPDALPDTTVASLSPELPESEDIPDAVDEPVRAEPAEPAPPDETSAETRYAVSGIWITSPDSPSPAALVPLNSVFEPGIDRRAGQRESRDAVALPKLASLQTDTALLAPSSPAAPGITFRLDARGLVIPTPEGAVNPDGIVVYAGRPPLVPPSTPDRTQIEPEIDPALAALAAFRPRVRPESLVEDTERANLGGLSKSELAAYRPAMRPKVVRTEEEEKAEEPDAPPTAQAVRVSLRPDTRPRNFARIVARATPKEPATKPSVTARTVAPRTVTPRIPSSTSVTREATVRNAINLSRINLIGVYGKPSERRALVRLSNGRYQKVKVGDRLDGGQVSAIGDSELRYQKRGRNVVLRMPKG